MEFFLESFGVSLVRSENCCSVREEVLLNQLFQCKSKVLCMFPFPFFFYLFIYLFILVVLYKYLNGIVSRGIESSWKWCEILLDLTPLCRRQFLKSFVIIS